MEECASGGQQRNQRATLSQTASWELSLHIEAQQQLKKGMNTLLQGDENK
jgi:hypothetical protein